MLKALRDPTLGDGKVYMSGQYQWAAFKKEFGPTGNYIDILVDVVNESVPESQRSLYGEIEEWYPRGIPDIFQAIYYKLSTSKPEKKLPSREQIQNHFQLEHIDIRGHTPPS